MLLLPTLSSLQRIAEKLAEPHHAFWLVKIGKFFLWCLPSDITWAAVYTQHATLWISFLGAVVATTWGKHLGLATTHFMKPGKLRFAAEAFSNVVFIITSLFLCYASLDLVISERSADLANEAMEGITMDRLPLGIPKWWSLLIMPVAFALMAIRMGFRATAPERPNPFELPPRSVGKSTGRWLLRALVILATIAMFYVGIQYKNLPALNKFIDSLAPWSNTIRLAGMISIGFAFILGTPVFVAISALTMILLFTSEANPLANIPTETFRLALNPTLPAIPLLTIAGYILAAGKSSQRLVRAYKSIFGWMPGGVAIMAVFVCAAFTTLTGASGVTILALGGLIYPTLLKEKYPQGFSIGLVTASGSLGLLFPPSLPVLLYAVTASQPGASQPVSAEQLYIGGLIPGFLMILIVCLYALYKGVRSKTPRQYFRLAEMMSALWAAKWDLLLPVIILASFGSGAATIVEAAALGAVYSLVVSLFIHKDVRPLQDLPFVLVQAGTLVGAVLVLLGVAAGFSNYLVLVDVPTKIIEWVLQHIQSPWVFLLTLNAILLVLGSILEIYSAIVVLVPLIAPLAQQYHVHPVHLGVIFLSNLELGFLLPPVGLNLLLASNRFRKPLPQLYKQALPFLLIMTIGVLIITYIEGATTWLLHLFKK